MQSSRFLLFGWTARRWLLIILAMTLAGRVLFVVLFGDRLTLDVAGYDDYAVNLVERGDFTRYDDRTADSDLPPLYPFFLAGVYQALGRSPIGVALVQIGFDLLTVLLLFAIGRRVGGAAVGLGAAACYALYPYLLFQNLTANDTAIFILLLTLAVWLAYRAADTRRLRDAALLGAALGLAALTKSFVIGLLPLLALAWWRAYGWRAAARLALVAGGVALLVIAPWVIRNTRLHDTLVLVSTNGGSNLHQGNNPCVADYLARGWDAQWVDCLDTPPSGLDEAALDEWHRTQALDYLRANPDDWPRLFGTKLAVLWSPAIMPYDVPPDVTLASDTVLQYHSTAFEIARVVHVIVFTPLLILGVIGLGLAWRDRRPVGPLVAVFAVVTLTYLAFHPSTRYRAPADPFVFVLAAYAVVRWVSGRRAGAERRENAG